MDEESEKKVNLFRIMLKKTRREKNEDEGTREQKRANIIDK